MGDSRTSLCVKVRVNELGFIRRLQLHQCIRQIRREGGGVFLPYPTFKGLRQTGFSLLLFRSSSLRLSTGLPEKEEGRVALIIRVFFALAPLATIHARYDTHAKGRRREGAAIPPLPSVTLCFLRNEPARRKWRRELRYRICGRNDVFSSLGY